MCKDIDSFFNDLDLHWCNICEDYTESIECDEDTASVSHTHACSICYFVRL